MTRALSLPSRSRSPRNPRSNHSGGSYAHTSNITIPRLSPSLSPLPLEPPALVQATFHHSASSILIPEPPDTPPPLAPACVVITVAASSRSISSQSSSASVPSHIIYHPPAIADAYPQFNDQDSHNSPTLSPSQSPEIVYPPSGYSPPQDVYPSRHPDPRAYGGHLHPGPLATPNGLSHSEPPSPLSSAEGHQVARGFTGDRYPYLFEPDLQYPGTPSDVHSPNAPQLRCGVQCQPGTGSSLQQLTPPTYKPPMASLTYRPPSHGTPVQTQPAARHSHEAAPAYVSHAHLSIYPTESMHVVHRSSTDGNTANTHMSAPPSHNGSQVPSPVQESPRDACGVPAVAPISQPFDDGYRSYAYLKPDLPQSQLPTPTDSAPTISEFPYRQEDERYPAYARGSSTFSTLTYSADQLAASRCSPPAATLVLTTTTMPAQRPTQLRVDVHTANARLHSHMSSAASSGNSVPIGAYSSHQTPQPQPETVSPQAHMRDMVVASASQQAVSESPHDKAGVNPPLHQPRPQHAMLGYGQRQYAGGYSFWSQGAVTGGWRAEGGLVP
ncbi:uncharacterized protein LAESUDRAFT_756315 [Laetiporus sulphureus 93-53]|uniref:Uncharacterized protein n=1 Tax=Laetiporus sulphureus 93-53 TaxID=1314785 RepID=A0A165GBN9_9APHY|nr:uncharacterized protein LAESUDRAFT_756315 [Laetiporus sulphureus 93-53]KZT10121.1 hypothetical protein LAESUDRAFT_756315 [Laetiporus sulphureus 93-53]